jgi:hypothetical protein
VQYYLVVFGVSLMLMALPVRSSQMDFYRAIPLYFPDLHAGVQKVGASVGIVLAGAQYRQLFALIGQQISFIEVLVLPYIME